MAMRTVVTMLTTLLAGCVAVPEEAPMDLLDDEASLSFHEVSSIPDRARPEPRDAVSPEPEPTPKRSRWRRGPHFEVGPKACWDVHAVGFPAISADGSTVITTQADYIQLSTFPGDFKLQWIDVATGEVIREQTLVDGEGWESRDDPDDDCRAVARLHRKRAWLINQELREQSWRTMEPVQVELFDPDMMSIEFLLEDTPPAERRPHAYLQWDELVVRTPGVRVYERHHVGPRGSLHSVYADRETGTVAAVSMWCIGESCTCDPQFQVTVVRWSPETFEAIDARPCEEEDGGCEGVDFGFNERSYPWSIG